MLLAIDPGPEQSAWLEFRDGRPWRFGIAANSEVLRVIAYGESDELAIECVASYGMPVGMDVFQTVEWCGRFMQHWEAFSWRGLLSLRTTGLVHRVYRRDVKLHLCGNARAKDANVRQALIDRYGPGKEKAIGKKATPGPLYGITSHVWSALAVAVTAADTMAGERVAA